MDRDSIYWKLNDMSEIWVAASLIIRTKEIHSKT